MAPQRVEAKIITARHIDLESDYSNVNDMIPFALFVLGFPLPLFFALCSSFRVEILAMFVLSCVIAWKIYRDTHSEISYIDPRLFYSLLITENDILIKPDKHGVLDRYRKRDVRALTQGKRTGGSDLADTQEESIALILPENLDTNTLDGHLVPRKMEIKKHTKPASLHPLQNHLRIVTKKSEIEYVLRFNSHSHAEQFDQMVAHWQLALPRK